MKKIMVVRQLVDSFVEGWKKELIQSALDEVSVEANGGKWEKL